MARVPEPAVRLRLQQVKERFLAAAVADEHEEGAAVRAVGAEYVDLYAPFRASPQGRFLLPHDAHASKAGNALIASVLAPPVANALRAGAE